VTVHGGPLLGPLRTLTCLVAPTRGWGQGSAGYGPRTIGSPRTCRICGDVQAGIVSTVSAKLRLKGPIHLACSETECWKCKRATPVFAIEASDLKNLEHGDASQPVGEPVFVHDIVGKLPASLQAGLTEHAPHYQPTLSRTTGATSWANQCVHCRALQGDFFMHSEPDGPFFSGPQRFNGTRILLTDKNIELENASYGLRACLCEHAAPSGAIQLVLPSELATVASSNL